MTRRPGAPGPTCAICAVELHDDPHWHTELEAFCCEQHCDNDGCLQFADGGGTGDTRPLSRQSGDHSSTSHAAVAPAAVGLLPAWALRDLHAHAVAVRQERLAWLVCACLWVWVLAVGLEAAQ
jgi:hypothetical protein